MKRKKMTPEEYAEYVEWKARSARNQSVLQERIDYYKAKIATQEQSEQANPG